MMKGRVVVGAMLVSEFPGLIEISVNSLLKWCDWILVVMDNESKETEEIVYDLQRRNYSKMFVRRSSIPKKVIARSGKVLNYHERWKSCKGVIRHDVFTNLKTILALDSPGYNKIDILLWPDHDVLFTDFLPVLLDSFMDSDKKAISMKHADVIGNMRTIFDSGIGHHVHIMKWNDRLAGIPRRFYALYHPLTSGDLMFAKNYSVHLAYLDSNIRAWRNDKWKTYDTSKIKTIKLNKDVTELSPDDIENNDKQNKELS